MSSLSLLLILNVHSNCLQRGTVELVLLPLEGIRGVKVIQTAPDLVELLVPETIQRLGFICWEGFHGAWHGIGCRSGWLRSSDLDPLGRRLDGWAWSSPFLVCISGWWRAS